MALDESLRLLPLRRAPEQSSRSVDAPLSLPDRAHARDPFSDLGLPDGWKVTTHAFPAAYPRSAVGSACSSVPQDDGGRPRLSKEEAQAAGLDVLKANTTAERRERPSSSTPDEPQLWIAVNRYVRKTTLQTRSTEPFTLILSHANGLHKETWEPAISTLLASKAGARVAEVWALDAVNHGDSAMLNRDRLGVVFDWRDVSRDLLQLVLKYLPPPAAEDPAFWLDEQELAEADRDMLELDWRSGRRERPRSRRQRRWRERRIALIGHSFGGCGSAMALSALPSLFEGLALVDPVMVPASVDRTAEIRALTISATGRTSRWPSRQDADSALAAHPFFKRWHPAVRTRYVQLGLYQIGDGGTAVGLKCSPTQEASVFSDPPRSDVKAYRRFQEVDPQTHVAIAFADLGRSVPGERTVQLIGAEWPWLASASRFKDAGHLVVQEDPHQVGEWLAHFLADLDALDGSKL